MSSFFDFSAAPKTTRPYDIGALVSCAAILILALVIGSFRQVGNFGVETDFYRAYAVEAENILAGRAYTYQHLAPGYMVLLAGVASWSHDVFTAGKIISAWATALLGLTMYVLIRGLFDARIALAATIMTLIALIPHSFIAATDTVGALLILLPLAVLFNRPVISQRRCLLAGVCAGAAYLVRYNAAPVMLGIGLALLFVNPDREGLRARAVKVGLFMGAALLTTSPWLIVNWKTHGSAFASTLHLQVAAHFYEPTGDWLEITVRELAPRFRSWSDVILYDPATLVRKFCKSVFYKNLKFLAFQGARFPAYFFVAPGLLLLLWNISRKQLVFLFACLTGYLFLGLVGFYIRYYFFLFPLLFASVAYFFFDQSVVPGVASLAARKIHGLFIGKKRRDPEDGPPAGAAAAAFWNPAIRWSSILVLAIFLSANSYRTVKRMLATEPRYLLPIAALLKSRSTPGETVIVRKPNLAYLAGRPWFFPQVETAGEFLAEGRRIGARFIVYSDSETTLWPPLKSLGDPDAAPAGLKLIYRHEPTHTLVYEIQP